MNKHAHIRTYVFTDIVTCPIETSKTQKRMAPHTTRKYTKTQHLPKL